VTDKLAASAGSVGAAVAADAVHTNTIKKSITKAKQIPTNFGLWQKHDDRPLKKSTFDCVAMSLVKAQLY
jgi:hypothetical protein